MLRNKVVANNASERKRLVLGTAQLGMKYGIANTSGKPSTREISAIISKAWHKGVRIFDTAQAYGNSETVLGKQFTALNIQNDAKVISKIILPDGSQWKNIEHNVTKSLRRLTVPKLYGLLLHDENMIGELGGELGDLLLQIKEKGLVEYVGVSVYSPSKAIAAIQSDSIDVIQIPSSIVDLRFFKKGIFELAQKYGKRIFVRSIFLQGLLLMRIRDLPSEMQFAAPLLNEYSELAKSVQKTKQQLAMGFARQSFSDAYVLFGADSEAQVEENVKCWGEPLNDMILYRATDLFAEVEEKILNPSLWPGN